MLRDVDVTHSSCVIASTMAAPLRSSSFISSGIG